MALEEIKSNPYPSEELLQEDREYLIKKLGISETIFEEILNAPVKKHTDYPSILNWYDRLRPYVRTAKKFKKAITGK
jgi:hypothetical protein